MFVKCILGPLFRNSEKRTKRHLAARKPLLTRVVPHRLKDSGYSVFRKPKTKSGLWQFGNRRLRLYVKVSLRGAARLKAALNFKP